MAIGRTNAGGAGSGATLVVQAPTGVTVKATKDNKTKVIKSNATGIAIFRGMESGTWSITITDGTQTTTKNVVIIADYSETIAFFSATISVSWPEGATCACSDGVTTLTAPASLTSYVFAVPNAGTWTVSCSDGDKTASSEVTIAADGETKTITLSYKYHLINGASRPVSFTARALSLSGSANKTTPYISSSGGKTYISATGGGGSGVYYGWLVSSNWAIDVSNYKKLVLKGTKSGAGSKYLRLWSSIGSSGNANVVKSAGVESATTTIDVSALSDKYIIGFAGEVTGGGSSEICVEELYLE